jgi:hypothetical protein
MLPACSPQRFNGYGGRARAGPARPPARDTVSHVRGTPAAANMQPSDSTGPRMASQNSALVASSAPSSLTALAEQLRDGPLQRLVELQIQTTALANRLPDNPPAIDDLEQLVRLSVLAMEHFHAFTRELAAVLRAITDAQVPPH